MEEIAAILGQLYHGMYLDENTADVHSVLRAIWGGDVIAAACVHIGATVQPRLLEGVWIAESHMDVHYDSRNPARVDGGHIRVPTGPGLGVVPDDGVFGNPVASFG